MNKQEIFNIVYNGLKNQKFKQSLGSNSDCVYRGKNNFKCALGHIIPDSVYEEGMEENDLERLLNEEQFNTFQEWFKQTFKIRGTADFLSDLQTIHDTCFEPKSMKRHLEDFAKNNNLKIPE